MEIEFPNGFHKVKIRNMNLVRTIQGSSSEAAEERFHLNSVSLLYTLMLEVRPTEIIPKVDNQS